MLQTEAKADDAHPYHNGGLPYSNANKLKQNRHSLPGQQQRSIPACEQMQMLS